MKYGLTFFLFLFAMIGCQERSQGVQRLEVGESSHHFKVVIGTVVKRDDNFSLYYTTDGTINFVKNTAIWAHVKGQPVEQEIAFDLPAGVFPSQLRIDMGNNANQEQLYVNWVKLYYKNKSVVFPGTYVFSYFRPDVNNTEINASTGEIIPKVINGARQTPSLYPKEGPLGEELEYLAE